MTIQLAAGSKSGTGSISFWNSDGSLQQICFYPSITVGNYTAQSDVNSIAMGPSSIAILQAGIAQLRFISNSSLSYIGTFDYGTMPGASTFPIKLFAVGSQFWVFSNDLEFSPKVKLDKFDSSGNYISTTTVDSSHSLVFSDVASWDMNTFYFLVNSNNPDIYRWTVGDTSATFIRNILTDMKAGFPSNSGQTFGICLHGSSILAAVAGNDGSTYEPNVGLFDLGSGASFIKRYMVVSFPQFSALPEGNGSIVPFSICSDGTHLWASNGTGPEIWKIDTTLDTTVLWNTEIQAFSSFITTDPRYPDIPAAFPTSDTDAVANSYQLDGHYGINVLDFAGKTLPYAHYDGLSDSVDYRFWPEVFPPIIITGNLLLNGLVAQVDVNVTSLGSGAPYVYTIDYGDGVTDSFTTSSVIHTFTHTYLDTTPKTIKVQVSDSLISNIVLLYPIWVSGSVSFGNQRTDFYPRHTSQRA